MNVIQNIFISFPAGAFQLHLFSEEAGFSVVRLLGLSCDYDLVPFACNISLSCDTDSEGVGGDGADALPRAKCRRAMLEVQRTRWLARQEKGRHATGLLGGFRVSSRTL